jgi:hypothetical protein
MSIKMNFPERIPMAGGLGQLSMSTDGSVIAARPFGNGRDPSPDVVIATRGSKKPKKLRLNTAGLFPAVDISPPITGLALVDLDDAIGLLATWDDQGRDGAGVGVFELDGAPRAIHWLLDEDARAERLRQSASSSVVSMSGSAGMIRDLCVSGDRRSFAFRIQDDVYSWQLSTLLDGGAARAIAKMPGWGLAIDTDHRVLTTSVDPDGSCFKALLGDGTVSRVGLPASPSIRVWSAADLLVTASGRIFDASGQLRGQLPGEAWGACATVDALVAIGENKAGPQLWILDATSLAVLHEQPAVGATSATKLAAVAGQNIAVGGKNCLYVLPWPLPGT